MPATTSAHAINYGTAVARLSGKIDSEAYAARFDGSAVQIQAVLRHVEGQNATLFAWHDLPWVYARGGLSNPTRYYASFHEGFFDDSRAEILLVLATTPPDYLLLADPPRRPFPELEAFAAAHYRELASGEGWRLYGRHGHGKPY